MARSHFAIASTAISVCVAGLLTVAAAQQQPAQQKPPAPVKPYKPLTLTFPGPINDPTFEAFRHKLGGVAARMDRASLTTMIVPQGFFWKHETKGEKADKNKSGFDNLAAAVQLDAPDGSGWQQLIGYAYDQTAAAIAGIKDTICSPADPTYNKTDMENLLKTTQTDLDEWGYPLVTGTEVRSGQKPNDPVIETLGLHFVRVLFDESAPPPAGPFPPALRVATPSGKTGFIPYFALAPLGKDQLCYRKIGAEWKIVGYMGGEP